MNRTVFLKTFGEPEVNKKEICRYMKADINDNLTNELILSCLREIKEKLSYKVCFAEYDINICEKDVLIGETKFCSKDLAKNLENAEKVVVFAATIGAEADRIIEKYNRLSPAKALAADAVCTERVESLCDAFNEEINKKAESEGKFTSPRFSAGYGDLSLTYQKQIFLMLDCGRKIGLTLNDSLLMSPAKSVTGFIGIGKKGCAASGCSVCLKENCEFRRNL